MAHDKDIFLFLFQPESLRSQNIPWLSADVRKSKGICIGAHECSILSALDLVQQTGYLAFKVVIITTIARSWYKSCMRERVQSTENIA